MKTKNNTLAPHQRFVRGQTPDEFVRGQTPDAQEDRGWEIGGDQVNS